MKCHSSNLDPTYLQIISYSQNIQPKANKSPPTKNKHFVPSPPARNCATGSEDILEKSVCSVSNQIPWTSSRSSLLLLWVTALPSLMLFSDSGLKYQKYVLDRHGWLLIHLDLLIICHFAENINSGEDMPVKAFRCPKRQINSKSVKNIKTIREIRSLWFLIPLTP